MIFFVDYLAVFYVDDVDDLVITIAGTSLIMLNTVICANLEFITKAPRAYEKHNLVLIVPANVYGVLVPHFIEARQRNLVCIEQAARSGKQSNTIATHRYLLVVVYHVKMNVSVEHDCESLFTA
jgi:hypothetical protein